MPHHDPIPSRSTPPGPAPREGVANPHAWARFRRIMAGMTALAATCAGIAVGWLYWSGTPLHLHMVIATVAGVFFTVMVGAGLMSLAFLSAGSGHDAEAAKRPEI